MFCHAHVLVCVYACLMRFEQMQVDSRDLSVVVGVESIEHFFHAVSCVFGRRLHTQDLPHITAGNGFVVGKP